MLSLKVKSRLLPDLCLLCTEEGLFWEDIWQRNQELGCIMKAEDYIFPMENNHVLSEGLIPKSSCMCFSLPSVCAVVRRDMERFPECCCYL